MLSSKDALIVVDVQRDFCSGGALTVEGGEEVVPVLNRWIEAARVSDAVVVASRDWHPPGHVSFKEQGGDWPPHCLQKSEGAELHSSLMLPEQTLIVSKGEDPSRDQYSAFDDTGLAEKLKDRGIRRLWVGGLAQDVCVRATVLDALEAGFDVRLIKPATRAVNVREGDGDRALQQMRDAGAVIEEAASPDES